MRRLEIWCLAVVAAALLAPWTPTPPFPHADKVAHSLLFAGLTCAVLMCAGRRRRRAGLIAVAVLALGGELAQAATPTRGFETADLIANLVGVALGAAACGVFRAIHPYREA